MSGKTLALLTAMCVAAASCSSGTDTAGSSHLTEPAEVTYPPGYLIAQECADRILDELLNMINAPSPEEYLLSVVLTYGRESKEARGVAVGFPHLRTTAYESGIDIAAEQVSQWAFNVCNATVDASEVPFQGD